MGLSHTFLSGLRDLIGERVQLGCRNKIRRWPAWDYTGGCGSLMSGATHILARFWYKYNLCRKSPLTACIKNTEMMQRNSITRRSLWNVDMCRKRYVLPGCLSVHLNRVPPSQPPSGHQWIINIKKLSHKCYSHPKDKSLTLKDECTWFCCRSRNLLSNPKLYYKCWII